VSAGRPNAVFCLVSSLLVLSYPGRGLLATTYAWYVIAFGIAYAGRLPVHLFLGRYVCLRPRDHDKPGLRARLNILVAVNAVSIAIWLVIGFNMLGASRPPSVATEVVLGSLWLSVLIVAVMTVRCVADVGLKRGTELLCESRLGALYLEHYGGAPPDSAFGRFLDWFRRKTPVHQISAFMILITAPLLTVPTASATARLAEEVVPIEIGAPPVVVEKEVTESDQDTPGQHVAPPATVSRTYEEECTGMPDPGVPAEEPYGGQLNTLWIGGEGVDGAGAVQAGCAERAEQVSASPVVWTAAGRCGSDLRSLGVAAEGYLPALLFEQAAEFAEAKAEDGVLVGASARHKLRSGDFYVIDVTEGSFVLIRANVSAGKAPADGGRPCRMIPVDDVAYSVLPPGLIGIWSEVVLRSGWVWPVEVTPPGSPSPEFTFRTTPDGSDLGRARCSSETSCVASVDGETFQTSGSLSITPAAILGLSG